MAQAERWYLMAINSRKMVTLFTGDYLRVKPIALQRSQARLVLHMSHSRSRWIEVARKQPRLPGGSALSCRVPENEISRFGSDCQKNIERDLKINKNQPTQTFPTETGFSPVTKYSDWLNVLALLACTRRLSRSLPWFVCRDGQLLRLC